MKHAYCLNFSGRGHLIEIVRLKGRSPWMKISVIDDFERDDFNERLDEELILYVYITESLADYLCSLEPIKNISPFKAESILLVFTARYSGFCGRDTEYYCHENGEDEKEIICLSVDQFNIHDCYINHERYEPILSVSLVKVA